MSFFSAISNIFGSRSASKAAKKDRELQRQFAQNGIRWKAADARAAGLHALAGLGASTPSYTPVGDGGAGQLLAQAGADVGAAVSKARNKGREDELFQLQKDEIRSQIGVNEAMAQTYLAEARNASRGATSMTSGINETPNLEAMPGTATTGSDADGLPARAPYTEDVEMIEQRYGDDSFLKWWKKMGNYGSDLHWHYYVKPVLRQHKGDDWINKTAQSDPKLLWQEYKRITDNRGDDEAPSATSAPKPSTGSKSRKSRRN